MWSKEERKGYSVNDHLRHRQEVLHIPMWHSEIASQGMQKHAVKPSHALAGLSIHVRCISDIQRKRLCSVFTSLKMHQYTLIIID